MAFSKFALEPSSKRRPAAIDPSLALHKQDTATPMKRRQGRRLVLCFLPALVWIFLFTTGVTLIPQSAKPPINITLLPFLDKHFFASSASWFPTDFGNPTLDLLAAIPYTLHPLLPFSYLALLAFQKDASTAVPHFVFSFGVLNLAAVTTHLACPTAPPWYYDKFGTQAANYSIRGDPAVLARVDQRFGLQLYEHMYVDAGKVVFGAWPSLHASWPYLIARLGLPPYLGWGRFVVYAWVPLVWWAAIYLRHHFAADVLGGVIYVEGALLFHDLIFSGRVLPLWLTGLFLRSKRKNGKQTMALPSDDDSGSELPLYNP